MKRERGGGSVGKSERNGSKVRQSNMSDTYKKYGLPAGLGIPGISLGDLRCVFQTAINIDDRQRKQGLNVRSVFCSSKNWDSSEISGNLLNSLEQSWNSVYCSPK